MVIKTEFTIAFTTSKVAKLTFHWLLLLLRLLLLMRLIVLHLSKPSVIHVVVARMKI